MAVSHATGKARSCVQDGEPELAHSPIGVVASANRTWHTNAISIWTIGTAELHARSCPLLTSQGLTNNSTHVSTKRCLERKCQMERQKTSPKEVLAWGWTEGLANPDLLLFHMLVHHIVALVKTGVHAHSLRVGESADVPLVLNGAIGWHM